VPASPTPSTGSAAPPAGEPPTSVLGLDVMTVTAAEAVRDAGVDDTEIAVSGWFTPAPPITCVPVTAVSPVQMSCPDQYVWLTEDADSLMHVNDDVVGIAIPKDRALNPDLDGLDLSWEPLPLQLGTVGHSTPAHVVFIGHFDDRRSSSCPADELAACEDRFVVDQVAWSNGREPRRSIVGPTDFPWTSSIAGVEAVIANEAPQSPILSIQIMHGSELSENQPSIEPSLTNGEGGLADRPGLWIVRVLESDRLSTYIVDDGTNQIYEMNAEGQAVSVGGPVPPASTDLTPWPPVGATVIPLSGDVVPGAPPVQLAVVDHSGRLVGVAEKGDVDPFDPSISVGDPGGYAEPGKPGRVHVAWTGSICDSRITVTIAADGRTITFDMGRRPPCDSIGITRQFVLDFSGAVDVSTIDFVPQVTNETDVPALTVDNPTVAITPSTHLHDGQTVEVHITGFGVGGKVFLSECASAAEATDLGCGAELAAQPFLVTDDGRAGSASFTVRAGADGSPLSVGLLTRCKDQCVLVATIGGGYPFIATPIAFDP
jgi:hypothetical protein